jgi:predicted HAD superfamily Cof-like phosphohydrolase
METIAHDNTPATYGMLHNTEGALNKASLSALAVVDSIVGAADDATSKVKPAFDQVAAMAHQAVDKAAGAALRRSTG